VLIDANPEAVEVMRARLPSIHPSAAAAEGGG
jgi:hypothetical protein